MYRRRSNDPCWCGSGKKMKRCHGAHRSAGREPVRPGRVSPMRSVPEHIGRPPYVLGERESRGVQILTAPEDLAAMRRACRVAAEVLAETGSQVRAGITTDELDAVAHAAYLERGAYPSTLGYGSWTKSICTSVNEVVCHGIPDDRPLVDGDIVNVDVTAFVDGFHGDTSAMFCVGEVDAPTQGLIDTTREALHAGIAAVRPGSSVRVIGAAIQELAEGRGYGVVPDITGHGIGRTFHAAPDILHVDHRSSTTEMVPGMVFTIEPMINAGSAQHLTWDDDWTIATADGLPSAQFEHTIVVTEAGAEVLTRR